VNDVKRVVVIDKVDDSYHTITLTATFDHPLSPTSLSRPRAQGRSNDVLGLSR
jgi:hypothetical protein